MARLTDKQKLWAERYIVHWNAAKAAREAGYEFEQDGHLNAHNAALGQYVAHLVAERSKRVKIDADYVLKRVVEIDQLDVGDLLDHYGSILPVKKWPKAWRTSISGLDFGKLIQIGDDPEALRQIIDKIKWPDKARNLELLGKHVNVKAWDKENQHSDSEAPPLNITFEVSPAKADVRVTNAKT